MSLRLASLANGFRHAAWVGAAALGWLVLAGCGQNPLLKIAAADYAPVKVGTSWLYVAPDGSPAFERRVVARGTYFGQDAYQVDTLGPGVTTTAYYAYSGSNVQTYNASVGWYVLRKLPYVTENRWTLPVIGAGTYTGYAVYVDGNEAVPTPAGEYKNCYRIRTSGLQYDSSTGVTGSTDIALAWAAPDVGDVKYATVNAGAVSVTAMLKLYSPGP